MSQPNRSTHSLFGTFHLEGVEFSLPVESLQEVVNCPRQITSLPLAPSYLLGIFNLRGMIVPVVSMRRLLEIPGDENSERSKVAIVDLEGARVGLLFDATGEILPIASELKSDFDYANSNGPKVIRGALKLDDGNRIVQILDPAALLRVENLPQILDRLQRHNPRLDIEAQARGQRRQGICFRAGETTLTLEIGAILEIIRVPELQKSVVDDERCLGTTNLRGHVLPILDFVRILGFRDAAPRNAADERILVLKVGTASVGLLVDSVDSILTFYRDEVLPIPLLSQTRGELFEGLISRQSEADRILLNAEGLLATGQIRELAENHAKMFGLSAQANTTRQRRSGERRVCIAFRLEHGFALPIHEIQEILNYPEQTLRPPGLPAQICGVVNLRGTAVTIVNLRALYGMTTPTDLRSTKILIVNHGSAKLGLLVDGVEDIVAFFEDQKLNLPMGLLRQESGETRLEIKEILELEMREEKKCLMILDLEKVLGRVGNLLTAA